jgi:hypothetical protein
MILNDSIFSFFLPTGNLKKLRNLLSSQYDYHFVLILVKVDFAILVPWTDPGPMCWAKSLKSYLIVKWFAASKLAAFGLSSQKLIFSNGTFWSGKLYQNVEIGIGMYKFDQSEV